MADEFISSIAPKLLVWGKWLGILFIAIIVVIAGIFFILELKKRKWKVEINEQKADGRLHVVGYDTLVEKKLKMGTKTVYWLKKNKCEVIPPPSGTTSRFKNKEEVAYLRVERDYVPIEKSISTDYNDPLVKKKITQINDKLLNKIRSIKTTFFSSDAVRSRFLYIPIERTLSTKMTFRPIDYDMNMMAMNQITNADEFYQSKYEFWKKYGAVIVFAITIVFLIIIVTLTYQYLTDMLASTQGKLDSTNTILQGMVDKMSGSKPPG